MRAGPAGRASDAGPKSILRKCRTAAAFFSSAADRKKGNTATKSEMYRMSNLCSRECNDAQTPVSPDDGFLAALADKQVLDKQGHLPRPKMTDSAHENEYAAIVPPSSSILIRDAGQFVGGRSPRHDATAELRREPRRFRRAERQRRSGAGSRFSPARPEPVRARYSAKRRYPPARSSTVLPAASPRAIRASAGVRSNSDITSSTGGELGAATGIRTKTAALRAKISRAENRIGTT